MRFFDALYVPSVSTVCALLAEDAPVFRAPSALTLHLQNYSRNPTDSLGANEVPLRGALQRAVEGPWAYPWLLAEQDRIRRAGFN